MKRIVAVSSNQGDVVLHPFCGCGTTVAAAQKMGRRWIGIDVTHLAITLIKTRLHHAYGGAAKYVVQATVYALVSAFLLLGRPRADQSKSPPVELVLIARGQLLTILGSRRLPNHFHDEAEGGNTKQAILSVKAGQLKAEYVRDLRGVVERDKAAIGVLITMEQPTKQMRAEAASAGFYESPGWHTKHSRLQITTVGERWTEEGGHAADEVDQRHL